MEARRQLSESWWSNIRLCGKPLPAELSCWPLASPLHQLTIFWHQPTWHTFPVNCIYPFFHLCLLTFSSEWQVSLLFVFHIHFMSISPYPMSLVFFLSEVRNVISYLKSSLCNFPLSHKWLSTTNIIHMVCEHFLVIHYKPSQGTVASNKASS